MNGTSKEVQTPLSLDVYIIHLLFSVANPRLMLLQLSRVIEVLLRSKLREGFLTDNNYIILLHIMLFP